VAPDSLHPTEVGIRLRNCETTGFLEVSGEKPSRLDSSDSWHQP
jgi:hypothetical protein